ncbi:hypothetical protein LO80_01720 [Candidatus Francisella endociliophora]|uniref:Uncharacterized protein n=1 Tax=Candidatus Francisella endociliophora TaxID=653937 RepID=A0A097EMN9_9GAMM|nr:hypothetical protein [Francisella sp. FSC1006]AIT08818.1 hypothetical protein LO80_01720 [Francisella sp. FSC1006]
MKLYKSLCLLAPLAISTSAYSYTLELVNNSKVDSRIYSTQPVIDEKAEAGSSTSVSSVRIEDATEIKTAASVPSQQSFGSLVKSSSNFTLQLTPQTYSEAWQDVKVEVKGSFGTGSYQAVLTPAGKVTASGICKAETHGGTGVTCALGSSDPSNVTITLTGGDTPSPVTDTVKMEYVGDWHKGGNEYHNGDWSGKSYAFVSYEGKYYAACGTTNWTAAPDEQIADTGEQEPWATYNGVAGDIDKKTSPCRRS